MILIIDNYDSFTYNLYQYIGVFQDDIRVIRNDKITVEEIEEMDPERIILSPGPKSPKDAGICLDVVKEFYDKKPMLGICLGHQCIGEAFGGNVSYAKALFHGKQSRITHEGTGLFQGIPSPIAVARYHSLAVQEEGLPEHKAKISEQEMRRMAEEKKGGNHSFCHALKKPGISIIGEFKQASPSLGKIVSKIDLTERMEKYSQSVDAVSCLTEEDYFLGNAEYLKRIRKMTELPILRKDFMIEPYQFYEAKVIGADAVLLIAAILDDVMMKDFYQLSRELGLDALVEVHDEREMERALKLDAEIIGVNNRNLKDFTISLDNTKRLSKYMPRKKIFVAESGIVSDEDVKFLKDCRVDAFLIGRAFMESENPKELAQKWKNL